MDPRKKQVIIILGPTASGKTSLAIALARYFQTEIISADSRQCYKELNIGVARPSEKELAAVPHHFIASHSIQHECSASGFEKFAVNKAMSLLEKNDTVIMAGGTGLYIRAFCEGLDEIPAVDPAIRERIIQEYEKNGIGWLQKQLKEKDPVFAEKGEMQNPQRMMRALEVFEATGNSIYHFRRTEKAQRPFAIKMIGIDLPKEELNQRIDLRVDQMMRQGLLDEVRSLQPFKHLGPLRTVGYSELFDHLEGLTDLPDAIKLIKTHSRQYAKRQMTWFRRDTSIHWLNKPEPAEALAFLQENK